MTKADIVERIVKKCGYTRKESESLLEAAFEIIKSTLEQSEDIKISKFGSFEVRQKKDRLGRNPQTGEAMTIEARKVLTFKPSNVLKAGINS